MIKVLKEKICRFVFLLRQKRAVSKSEAASQMVVWCEKMGWKASHLKGITRIQVSERLELEVPHKQLPAVPLEFREDLNLNIKLTRGLSGKSATGIEQDVRRAEGMATTLARSMQHAFDLEQALAPQTKNEEKEDQ